MDEEFTTTAYPNVQENFKQLIEDRFFMEKPQEEEPGKTNVKAEVSKVVDEIVTNTVDWAMQAPLRARFRDLPTIDIKEILQQRIFEDNTYKTQEVHNDLYEALQKSVELDYSNQCLADQEEARKKKRKRRESPRTPPGSPPTQPPPTPPLAGVFGALGTSGASGSSYFPPPLHPLSTGTSGSEQQQGSQAPTDIPEAQELFPTDYLMQDDSILEEQWKPLPKEERPATLEPAWTIPSSNKSDVVNNWASTLATTYEPPAENSLLAKIRDMTTFINWYFQKVNKTVLTQADFEGHAYEVTNPKGDQVRINVNRPLPLGGPLGHVTIQPQFFFNKDLKYLGYGNKGIIPALSISKMKVASYLDFGIELLVPEQMWIDDVCTYDISAKYGISHWWFNRQKFYIDRHDSPSRRKDVRTHMWILSVVRIKAYSRYGYDYLSEIILRRADFQEHTIDEKKLRTCIPVTLKT
ncbi:hypothetical protein Tco_0250845 [Tanacetum coccineum]